MKREIEKRIAGRIKRSCIWCLSDMYLGGKDIDEAMWKDDQVTFG